MSDEKINAEDYGSTRSSTPDYYQPNFNTPERFKSFTSTLNHEVINAEDNTSYKTNSKIN